jgi:hypothetical protein
VKLARNFGDDSAKISIDILTKPEFEVRMKMYKRKEGDKGNKCTCLSVSVRSIRPFLGFLEALSAIELLVLFEPCQEDYRNVTR